MRHPSKREYSCRKWGEAGWLSVSGKAKRGRKAGAGGHAPLLRSRPRDPSGRPLSSTPSGLSLLSRRVAAGAPSEPPFTKRITNRSGDRGYPPNTLRHKGCSVADLRAAARPPRTIVGAMDTGDASHTQAGRSPRAAKHLCSRSN